MKKKVLYVALFALALIACTEQDIAELPSPPHRGNGDLLSR